jgi:hypothetical protein
MPETNPTRPFMTGAPPARDATTLALAARADVSPSDRVVIEFVPAADDPARRSALQYQARASTLTADLRGRSENQRPGTGRTDGSFAPTGRVRAGIPPAGHDGSCSDWNSAISDHMSLPSST